MNTNMMLKSSSNFRTENHTFYKLLISFLLMIILCFFTNNLYPNTNDQNSELFQVSLISQNLFEKINENRAALNYDPLADSNQMFLIAQGIADHIAENGQDAEDDIDCILQVHNFYYSENLEVYTGYGTDLDDILLDYQSDRSYFTQYLTHGGVGIANMAESDRFVVVIMTTIIGVEIFSLPVIAHAGEYQFRWRSANESEMEAQNSQQENERRVPGMSLNPYSHVRTSPGSITCYVVNPEREYDILAYHFAGGYFVSNIDMNTPGEYEIEWHRSTSNNETGVELLQHIVVQSVPLDQEINLNDCNYSLPASSSNQEQECLELIENTLYGNESDTPALYLPWQQILNSWAALTEEPQPALSDYLHDNSIIESTISIIQISGESYDDLINQLSSQDIAAQMNLQINNACAIKLTQNDSGYQLIYIAGYRLLENIRINIRSGRLEISGTALEQVNVNLYINDDLVSNYNLPSDRTFNINLSGEFYSDDEIVIKGMIDGLEIELFRF